MVYPAVKAAIFTVRITDRIDTATVMLKKNIENEGSVTVRSRKQEEA